MTTTVLSQHEDAPPRDDAKRVTMRRVAEAFREDAHIRTTRYERGGALWQAANYLLVIATAAGAAGGGAALGGVPWLAAVLAFTAAAASAAAQPAAAAVRRQAAKKVQWRQVGRRADLFLNAVLPQSSLEEAEASFRDLARFVEDSEAIGAIS